MADPATISGSFRVTKSNDVAQNIFGHASIILKADGTIVEDHQGDVIPLDELEHAAYDFVLEARESGEDHDGGPTDGRLIESVVITPEKLEAWGLAPDAIDTGWWLGFHIDDPQSYERAKTEKSAFSIEGTAIREPA